MIIILVLIVPVALALFILWMERLESVILNQPPLPTTEEKVEEGRVSEISGEPVSDE